MDEEYEVVSDRTAEVVGGGTALACVLALLDRMDPVELLELERHHLPRVLAKNPSARIVKAVR